jgi:hypothetical protein
MQYRKEKPVAVWQNELNERKSREEYFALLENDPEHRYEYLDGLIYQSGASNANWTR